MTSATPDLPVRLPSWLRSITSLIIVLFGDRSRCVCVSGLPRAVLDSAVGKTRTRNFSITIVRCSTTSYRTTHFNTLQSVVHWVHRKMRITKNLVQLMFACFRCKKKSQNKYAMPNIDNTPREEGGVLSFDNDFLY